MSEDTGSAGPLFDALRSVNRGLAVAVGLVLLATVGLVLFDVAARPFGLSLGGTDEISGYVMAIATAWGMAFAVTELAHVRIAVLRVRLPSAGRAVLDLLALTATALTVSIIAWWAWPVVARSIANASRANTPLETPLAWVQVPWMLGWAWFAFTAWAVMALSIVALLQGRRKELDRIAGPGDETA